MNSSPQAAPTPLATDISETLDLAQESLVVSEPSVKIEKKSIGLTVHGALSASPSICLSKDAYWSLYQVELGLTYFGNGLKAERLSEPTASNQKWLLTATETETERLSFKDKDGNEFSSVLLCRDPQPKNPWFWHIKFGNDQEALREESSKINPRTS